ncbi:hypothetical protein GUJ93_ZPchr0012g20443 [Zizania palustris]|uniref:Peptidase M20 dimerisation domain-containing protein n=1 Tax=Zizania palustris TaxID=103762 RepID=A0A8J6BWS0_ZIZPA|nr:hypothetical protein GUJ93_ZPchr0012g20443 [Zizania palustris]
MLKRSGFQPKRTLEVIMFTSEEPTRFGISCLGSRLMAGSEELAQSLKETVDCQNISFFDASETAGYKMHPEDLHSVFMKKDSYFAFIELHIEQGPILEKEGILQLHPGAINSIPSKSHVEIDVRDIDEKRRNNVIDKVHQSAIEISKNRGVVLSEFKIINQDPPALSDKSVITAMEFAAKQLNLEYKLMISRAYHDSLFMARISPIGMIFIPCYKGYSHKPEEYASPEDIANGVKVLALTMVRLSLQ